MRPLSRVATTVLASAALMIGIASPVAGDVDGPRSEGETAPADDRASARNIRATFRLDSTDQAIQAAESALDSVEFMGIHLSPTEHAAVDRQLEREELVEAVGDSIEATVGGGFAAIWADRDLRSIVLALKGTVNENTLSEIAVLLRDEPFEVVSVDRSSEDLGRLSSEILSAPYDPNASYAIRSLGREPTANRLVISVTGDVEDARASLTKRYGDWLVVEQLNATPLSRTSGPPWQPGKQMFSTTTGGHCTGAYGVQMHGVNYVLTAGHCKLVANQGTYWGVGTTLLGPMDPYFWGVTVADVAMIRPLYSTWVANNCIYTTATACELVLSYQDPKVGTTVCYSGGITGNYCGVASIERDAVPFFGWGGTVYDTVEATGFPAGSLCPGDSGAPVFRPAGTGYAYGRGLVSYRTNGSSCTSPTSLGITRWSNIQSTLRIRGGCNGSWIDNASCPWTPFSDVGVNHLAHSATSWATSQGIDSGSGGQFDLAGNLDRGTAAAWLWRLAGSPSGFPLPSYTDVGPSHPFRTAISWAVTNGFMDGFGTGCATGNPCFRPTDPTTKEAWAGALHVLAGSPAIPSTYQPQGGVCDIPASHPSFDAIMWSVRDRIIRGHPRATPPDCIPSPDWGYTQRYYPTLAISRQAAIVGLYEVTH